MSCEICEGYKLIIKNLEETIEIYQKKEENSKKIIKLLKAK